MNNQISNNSNNYVDLFLHTPNLVINSFQNEAPTPAQQTGLRFWSKRNRTIISLMILVLAFGMIVNSASAAPQANLPHGLEKQINIIEVTTIADLLNLGDGLCSLREAIISANTNPRGVVIAGECANGSATMTDRIILESGMTYQLINFNNPAVDDATANDLDIVDNIPVIDLQIMPNDTGMALIRGTAPAFDVQVGVDGFSKSRIFDIHAATVQMYRLDIRHGVAMHTRAGGGIQNTEGTVTLVDSKLTENRSPRGGAIANLGGTVSLIRTEITVNGNHFQDGLSDELSIYGGGIYNSGENAQLFLEESTVSWNRIDFNNAAQPIGRAGGGIYNYRGTVTFLPGNDASEIIHNKTHAGGAVHNEGGVIQGSNFSIFGNQTLGNFESGGGLFNVSGYTGEIPGEINLSDGFIGFHSTGTGLYNLGSASLTDVNLGSNSKTGIINQGGDLTFVGGRLQINDESGLISDGGTVTIDRAQVRDNENIGKSGGGIRLLNGVDATITSSSITTNSAQSGAGIFIYNSSLTMANSTVSGNETWIGVGGGIMVQGNSASEQVEFINVTVHDNSSQAGVGSAFYLLSGTIVPETVNSIWSGPKGETACASNTGGNPLSSYGYNLSSDETCLSMGDPTDQTNTDPQLDTLVDMEKTKGHQLLKSSPARDQGDAMVCSAAPVNNEDQQGFPRGSICDIGAVELDGTD